MKDRKRQKQRTGIRTRTRRKEEEGEQNAKKICNASCTISFEIS